MREDCVSCLYNSKRHFTFSVFVTNKTKRISFKTGCVVQMGKRLVCSVAVEIVVYNSFVLLLKVLLLMCLSVNPS